MDAEPRHPILHKPWTYELVRIEWRLSPMVAETYIDLTFRKEDIVRRLRFLSPTEVQIKKGFYGHCSGLVIQNIQSRGWDNIRIAVANTEQDPGITFFAADVIDLEAAEDG